ncbi:hypothetical protein DFQ26_009289 [Actinomortierella ambigua]|nr:hypothetical protein DFQ26_009289 [Actinomortierella ambigua]
MSFEVQPGEKIGIVGRTGSGKSSLTLALFRTIETANSHWAKASYNRPNISADDTNLIGESSEYFEPDVNENSQEDGESIWIDGIDVSMVSLKYLRRHLAIIPQDPTLFAGTLRDNFDPFSEMQDADLWRALERAHLKDHIATLPGGLQHKVTTNGENFSVAFLLARALLSRAKIQVLDEATSSVHVQTDELIQRTTRTEFKDRNIFTIAHCIKTVMSSDKILVLEKGELQEYASPAVLLNDKSSHLYRLAEQSGELKRGD